MLTIHNIHQYIAADDRVSKCIATKSLAIVMATLNEVGINKDLSIDPDYQITPLTLAILFHREDVSFKLLQTPGIDLNCFNSNSNPLAIALDIYNHHISSDKLVIIIALITKHPEFCSTENGILQTYIINSKIKKYVISVRKFDVCNDLAIKIKMAVDLLDYYHQEFKQCGSIISRIWIRRIAAGILKLDQENSLRPLVVADSKIGYAISKFLYPEVKNVHIQVKEDEKLALYNSFMALGHYYLLNTERSLKERLTKALECFYHAREKAREHQLVLSVTDQAFMHRFSCYLQLLDVKDLTELPTTFLNYSQWGAIMVFETRAQDLPEVSSYLKAYTQQGEIASVKISAEYLRNRQLDLPVSDYNGQLLQALEYFYGIDQPIDLEEAKARFDELAEHYNERGSSKMEYNTYIYSMMTVLRMIHRICADNALEMKEKLSALSRHISILTDPLLVLPTIYGSNRLLQQPVLILSDLIRFLNQKIPESKNIQSRLRSILTGYIKNKLSLYTVDTLINIVESLNLFPDKQRVPYIELRGKIYSLLSQSDIEANKQKWVFLAVSLDNMERIDDIFKLNVAFDDVVKFLDSTIKRACLKNNARVIIKLHAIISQFDEANYQDDIKPQNFINLLQFANCAIRYAKALSLFSTEARMLELVNDGFLPALINYTMIASNRRKFDCLFYCAWLMGELMMNSAKFKSEYNLSVKDRLYVEKVITDFLARDEFKLDFVTNHHHSWFLGIIEHFKGLHNKFVIESDDDFSVEAVIVQSAIKSNVFPDFIEYLTPRRNLNSDYFERLELDYREMERVYGNDILYASNPVVQVELEQIEPAGQMEPFRQSSAHLSKSIFNTSLRANASGKPVDEKVETARQAPAC